MSRKLKNRIPNNKIYSLSNFKPKTKKQTELLNLIDSKEIIVSIGIAGSGKTITSLAGSLNLLGDYYKNLILVKSVVTIPGEEIGFLKGSMEKKMEPFLMSYIWNVDKLLGYGATEDLIKKDIIKILPLAYIRGLSIDNSIVIIDEAQNLDTHTFKTLVTRIGERSKYIFLGDIEQIDRKKKEESCLETVLKIFKDSNEIGTVEFHDSDCVRNPIIPGILKKLREHNF